LKVGRVTERLDRAQVIRIGDLRATPWPNGGGWTKEIRVQLSAQDRARPVWRLSMATIDSTGPFSVLPAVRRCLLLASDTSLHLSIDGVLHTLGYTDSVAFDGGAAVEVVALSGTCLALNLMTYGGAGGRLEVSRPAGSFDLSARDAAAVVVLEGRLHALNQTLGRYDTLVPARERVNVTSEAATVVGVSLDETRTPTIED
jgi:environmental stress-induced protein Ves